MQTNLTLSIRTIDFGLGVLNNSGYDLTTLRLGKLMREAGYEPTGADPDRNYSGEMPWFGSLPEVSRRIAALQRQREDAQAALDEALLDDEARERRAAEATARRDALNAAPRRKTRGDGSQYDRYADALGHVPVDQLLTVYCDFCDETGSRFGLLAGPPPGGAVRTSACMKPAGGNGFRAS